MIVDTHVFLSHDHSLQPTRPCVFSLCWDLRLYQYSTVFSVPVDLIFVINAYTMLDLLASEVTTDFQIALLCALQNRAE